MSNQYSVKRYIDDYVKECSDCGVYKPHSEFYFEKRNKAMRSLSYYCKTCAKAHSNRNHFNRVQTDANYRSQKRNYYIKSRFGITLTEYLEKLTAQDFKCVICRVELPASGSKTHLDHDHKTGQIRAFLCTNCNRGLGHFQDQSDYLRKAADYLDAHKLRVCATESEEIL